MCIIVGSILILMMSEVFSERIQMVLSCLTHSLRWLCWIPLINKYRLLLLKFVGVTSIQMMFSIAFAYMMSEKEDNVSLALKRCRDQLHSKDMSSKVVVTDQKNALMNVFDTVFLEASSLVCKYHIKRNVIAKCKTNCKVKDLKGKDGKEIKSSEVGKTVMVALEGVVNSDIEQAYVDTSMGKKLQVLQKKSKK